MKLKVHSFYDSKGNLAVDCTECERGRNGSDINKCSAGWRTKKPGMYCFVGVIIPKFKEALDGK